MKIMSKALSVVFLLTIIVNCTPNSLKRSFQKLSPSKIINGTPVPEENGLSKSVVGLLMNYEFGDGQKIWIQGCTGSVLNKNFILTAAHCVNHMAPTDLAINFTKTSLVFEKQFNPATRITDIEKVFVIRKVKSYIQHAKYDDSGNFDLALIRLEDEIPADAVPVQFLPDQLVNLAENKTSFDLQNVNVILMGFGLVSESPQTDTEVLRETIVPAQFINHLVVTDQTKGTGGCNGDSGGPAFYTFENVTYQVGVTHGPHGQSTTCHEQGEWVNPGLNKDFLTSGQAELLQQN